jgi:K+-sensing histidine kinase KdpD/DNA-binding winged helix-turn-helix (wHTH) protein
METKMITPAAGRRGSGRPLAGFAAALLMIASATLLGLLIAPRWGNAAVVLLYLPPVLAAAIYSGLWPSLVAALASTLAYNFYFTAPYRTFVIHSPADVVTVIVLLLVALVTSHLASSLRDQARLAAAHAARNATIAGLARRLLASADEHEIADVAVRELSRLFDCNSVLVTGPDDPRVVASAPGQAALAPSDFAAAAHTLTTGEPTGRGVRRGNLADWQFRIVASDQAPIAAIGMARDDGAAPVDESQVPLLGNLLDQVALALERARLQSGALEFAKLRERDRLRSALLASVGEDVKPRISAIIHAGRALRRDGSADKALVSAVCSEASTLDRYVDNLLDANPASDQSPFDFGHVKVDLYRRSVLREGAEVHLTPKEFAVLAELARHAGRVLTHSHLLRTVWGPAQEGQIEYLRVAIRSLRQKLENAPSRPELILNEPAVGYRLVAPGPERTETAHEHSR